ncbi:hypothetical protein CAEBREN_24462 [Caenorhabditis brenneri]|uniref:Uncharacterized protein n=1 Tax=Caenorhabditis brenneri TaxID=135651 RepID=G0PA88_CAEBE|nr:hypothetical protein CAEBREN_24462 [Caenorhabditis brenneri]
MAMRKRGTTSAEDQVCRKKQSLDERPASTPTHMAVKTELPPAKMINFLLNKEKYECVIRILHANVAQKSYGSERRFFCPPPSVYLIGGGWKEKSELVVHINIDSDHSKWQKLNCSTGKDYCVAKEFHVSNSDERESFDLKTQLFFGCGNEIASFVSKPITIISKPSKKKQMKSNDRKHMYITSGTNVALFNRPHSQRFRTRYLHFEGNDFQASSTKWGAFTIHLLDEERGIQETGNFAVRDGFLYYGSAVSLVDSVTGIALPRMRIRKVDKKQVILDTTCSVEPVTQLNNCAFQMIDNEMEYLSLSQDKIVQHKAQAIDENRHQINDGAAWTIISAEKAEYRFFEAMGQVDTPITPCPVFGNLEVNGHGEDARVELRGRDFKPNLKIWFGSTPVDTTFRSDECLLCDLPPVTQVRNEQTKGMFTNETTGDCEVPISLVRDDGVIYSSGLTYSYKSMERHGTVRTAPGYQMQTL